MASHTTFFTQAAQALRQPNSPVLGGLPVEQIIGTGVPQSTMRLVPYINAFHPRGAGTGNPACQTNPFLSWQVADSGWDHLRAWVAGGAASPGAPRIEFTRTPTFAAIPSGDTNSLIARDEMGNAVGGIRTPPIDAPVGSYYGTSPCNPGTFGFDDRAMSPLSYPAWASARA